MSLPILYHVILLLLYITISHSFLLLMTFAEIHPLLNQICLNKNGSSLIKKTLFLTAYLYNGNVDQSFVNYLIKFNSISDMRALLQKLSKQKLKFRNKLWIYLRLQKSVSSKNNFFTKYIRLEDLTMKNEAHIKYKQYKKLLSTLLRESKRSYLTKYF